MTMDHFKIYCEIAISSSIVQRAIKVSLIVGSTLNLINQGDALLLLDIQNLSYLKLGLTYIVPYSVTTYTATTMKAEFQIGTKAVLNANLKCSKCTETIYVEKGTLIPECPACGIHTRWKLK
ncbi:nitrate/nitrite transporter NrtS [Sulfurimonas sp. SAG-AH-194-I05]|nr:nitrate/nitrite transporter NrtS [Sulfurimonas sp. SAG-AH-194-I05]MDF1875143.1 nitrate/nitrite transporter NrtS [Sulfurimonas sp. SAG-AH-194-I05]